MDQALIYGPFGSVLEVGSRDINGGVRDIFQGAFFHGVDVADGPGVDEVIDFATRVRPSTEQWDCVVCCEVLEHADDETAERILSNAHDHLCHEGLLLLTAAGVGRHEHSAHYEGPPLRGEFYRNVSLADLTTWLRAAGFDLFEVDTLGVDIRATAWKGMTRHPMELIEHEAGL
jgi:SAM-dependent methyltransferase